MAKRTIPRRKARKTVKPKTYEVDGHQLTQAQWDLYQQNLEYRNRGMVARTVRESRALALQDTFYAERATTKAMESIRPLTLRAYAAAESLGGMERFRFTPKDPKLSQLGNAVIRHCSQELFAIVMELNSIYEGVAKQIEPEASIAV